MCCMLSRVWFFATPWTVARQASLSTEFSRQEYWSGLPFPTPGDLPDPRIEPKSPASPALSGGFLPLCLLGSPSVQFCCSVVSDFSRPQESQHARPPCPSPTPGPISLHQGAALGTRIKDYLARHPNQTHCSTAHWVNRRKGMGINLPEEAAFSDPSTVNKWGIPPSRLYNAQGAWEVRCYLHSLPISRVICQLTNQAGRRISSFERKEQADVIFCIPVSPRVWTPSGCLWNTF